MISGAFQVLVLLVPLSNTQLAEGNHMSTQKKIKSIRQQQGYGLIEWLLILLVVAFLFLVGFRVVPLYSENQFVVAGLKDLVKADENLNDLTDAEIRKKMDNFYNINGVRSEGAQNIEIEREDDKVVVKIEYDAEVNLFTDQPVIGTVKVVIPFRNHLDSEFPNDCCKPRKATDK
jgi:competence protein ComGC